MFCDKQESWNPWHAYLPIIVCTPTGCLVNSPTENQLNNQNILGKRRVFSAISCLSLARYQVKSNNGTVPHGTRRDQVSHHQATINKRLDQVRNDKTTCGSWIGKRNKLSLQRKFLRYTSNRYLRHNNNNVVSWEKTISCHKKSKTSIYTARHKPCSILTMQCLALRRVNTCRNALKH